MAEGKCAAKNIMGLDAAMDYEVVPRCAYTSPEIAAVGLTESQAREKHAGRIRISKFPLAANSKAVLFGKTAGMVKVIADEKYGQVLGVGIIGPHATEMIGEAVLAIRLEATADDIASSIHLHPSLSEALMEASEAVNGRAIHI
jgi:dihydrolipoamide dehydrogenase